MSNWQQPEPATPTPVRKPHPHALTEEEHEPFKHLTTIISMRSVSAAMGLDDPEFDVALMRVWYDGQPRAAIVISHHEDDDPAEVMTVTPIALLMVEGDFERMSDTSPADG
jgi:hypothetical protein